jgi:outer membrane protein
VLAAQTQHELARAAFADATGLPNAELKALGANANAGVASLPALSQWLADAKTRNPQLRVQLAAAEVAEREAAKFDALAAPTLDIVAEIGQDRINGSGDYGDASNRQNNALIGLQLVVPLYTGGWRGAKQTETQRLAEKAATDAERGAQQVAADARCVARPDGRRRPHQCRRRAWQPPRLDATRVGREAASTTLDLLNAENDAAGANSRAAGAHRCCSIGCASRHLPAARRDAATAVNFTSWRGAPR